jgi:hypothetical protein
MKKNRLPAEFPLFLIAAVIFSTLLVGPHITRQVLSVASHVVISEIQVTGGGTTDEIVELYNPTGDTVNLAGWRLTRKTASGATENNLVASLSGTIAPQGYFLIAHPDYDGAVAADLPYSATTSAIAANNTVTLYSDAGTTVVDLVGMGSATSSESATTVNPAANGSIERKASPSSTADSMGPGGSEETAGNGEDSDNNTNDFVSRTTSDPQNTSSPIEPPPSTPTPTDEPTPTPTPTPTDEPTPTPTETPTPTVTPTPTPTEEPTPTPTPSETPTPTPTETPVPTVTPTPTPTPMSANPRVTLKGLLFSCTLEYLPIRIFGFTFRMPRVSCSRH